jgi:hypothetical protein
VVRVEGGEGGGGGVELVAVVAGEGFQIATCRG